jgi:hypothetical protein
MHFLVGLTKIAALTYHNDGSEFKVNDTDPAAYEPRAGGMAPTGIPSYDPSGANKWQPVKKETPGDKKKKDALLIAMGKEGMADTGALDYVGTKSDAADTLATQLKWDKSDKGDEIPENFGYNRHKAKQRILAQRRKP